MHRFCVAESPSGVSELNGTYDMYALLLFFLKGHSGLMLSANHIQVVNNNVGCNVNKMTEKLVCLLLLILFFVVNRRACLRDRNQNKNNLASLFCLIFKKSSVEGKI